MRSVHLLPWLACVLLIGCSSSVDPEGGGGTGGGSGGGGGTEDAVECDVAEDGDPCAQDDAEWCGPLDGYGCIKSCEDGTWSVTCTEAPTCPEQPVPWLGVCDPFYEPSECGPYEIETPCGPESIVAECTALGWTFPTECAPDCREATDEASCGELLDCIWFVSCFDGQASCASLSRPIDQGGIHHFACEYTECPEGTTCVSFGINPQDPASGNCEGSGSLWITCEPSR